MSWQIIGPFTLAKLMHVHISVVMNWCTSPRIAAGEVVWCDMKHIRVYFSIEFYCYRMLIQLYNVNTINVHCFSCTWWCMVAWKGLLYALVTHKYFLNYCTCNNLMFLSLLFIDLLSIGVIKLKRKTLETLAHHNCPTCLVNQQEIKETKQCKDFE